MRICLMIEGQEDVSWDQWVSIALACEEHGLDALFRSDHYLSFDAPTERGALDAWTTIAALGARTARIRLGTLVSPITFRHPSLLAKAVATADHASGGRVELGMGAGWFEPEHTAYGFPFPEPRERVDHLVEQVEVVHRLLSHNEGPVTFEGRHYRLDGGPGLPKPVQEPHPPLILGGQAGPRAVRLAARFADEYNLHLKTPEQMAEARDRLLRACEAEGRDPAQIRLSLMTTLVIGATRQELLDRAWQLMSRTREDEGIDPARFLDDLRPGAIRGTTDQVLERLSQYAAAGVDRVMLQHLVHDDLDTIGLIGRELVPAAADL